MKQFFIRRVLKPLKQQLSQGVTPGKLAVALALGLVIGSVPIIGITSLICAVVAVVFRLNQPAIQVANYLAYPLQIGLFIPFFHAGADLFSAPRVTFTVASLTDELSADLAGTMGKYAAANARAVAAWAVVAPVAVVLLSVVLRVILARARLGARAAGEGRSTGPLSSDVASSPSEGH
ncbi:MAG: DUF2062 domain-containing protein [Myxococcota bacterium]